LKGGAGEPRGWQAAGPGPPHLQVFAIRYPLTSYITCAARRSVRLEFCGMDLRYAVRTLRRSPGFPHGVHPASTR